MEKLTITVNGEDSATGAADLLQLVAELTGRKLASSGQPLDGTRLGVAVAVNASVVPRSQWSGRALTEGDDVELVTAVQGG
jgi:sulfur carrier protein